MVTLCQGLGRIARENLAAQAALPLRAELPPRALFQCEEAESDLGAAGGRVHTVPFMELSIGSVFCSLFFRWPRVGDKFRSFVI